MVQMRDLPQYGQGFGLVGPPLLYSNQSSLGGTSVTCYPAAGKLYVVACAWAYHDDGANPHTLQWQQVTQTPWETCNLMAGLSRTTGQELQLYSRVPCQRPFFVSSTRYLRVLSSDAVGGACRIYLRCLFYRVRGMEGYSDV